MSYYDELIENVFEEEENSENKYFTDNKKFKGNRKFQIDF
jgi:hypothetical protein